MLHGNAPMGQIHTPFNWIFSDAAAREAHAPSTGDALKSALQLSDLTVWFLTSTLSWAPMGSGGGGGGAWPTPEDINAERAGVAAALVTAHEGSANPHPAYALASAIAPLQAQIDGKAALNHSHPGTPAVPVVLGAPFATNSITLTDVPGMAFAVEANATYLLTFRLPFKTSNGTRGAGFAFGCTAAIELLNHLHQIPTTSRYLNSGNYYGTDTGILSTGYEVVNVPIMAMIDGLLKTGATGGTLNLKFRGEATDATYTLLAGATGIVQRVA